jgi:hypothetical protein
MVPEKTHLVILIDRSGSMASIRAEMESALASLLRDQQTPPGELTVSYSRFDDNLEEVFTQLPVREVRPLTIRPRGSTALLDAFAVTIDRTVQRFVNSPGMGRPTKTLFIVVTDGQENASRLYTWEDVRARLLAAQALHGFDFMFMGTNIDSIETAARMGIQRKDAMDFMSDKVDLAGEALSRGIARKRAAHRPQEVECFMDIDRDEQLKPRPYRRRGTRR